MTDEKTADCSSAKELQTKCNIRSNGEYLLTLTCPTTKQRRKVPIYCADMTSSEPKEYITLKESWRSNRSEIVNAIKESAIPQATSFGDVNALLDIIMYYVIEPLEQKHNFSTVRAGGTAKGTSIRTVFDRVRFDVAKFEIICYDLRYSTTNKDADIVLTGGNGSYKTVYDSFFYGCGYGSSSGRSNWAAFDVNLCGTPFGINYELCTFKPFGWAPQGELDQTQNKEQHVAGKGIGYQGGIGACPGFANFRNATSNGDAMTFAKKVHITIPVKFV